MTTNTDNTATIINFLNAVESHDDLALRVNQSWVDRNGAMTALKSMGFTSIQSIKDEKKPLTPNQMAYSEKLITALGLRYVTQYNTRELLLKEKSPDYKINNHTAAGKKAAIKQYLSSINYYLKSGQFITNVGRDGFKFEIQECNIVISNLEAEIKTANEAKIAAEVALKTIIKVDLTTTTPPTPTTTPTTTPETPKQKKAREALEKQAINSEAAKTARAEEIAKQAMIVAQREMEIEELTMELEDTKKKLETLESKKPDTTLKNKLESANKALEKVLAEKVALETLYAGASAETVRHLVAVNDKKAIGILIKLLQAAYKEMK